MILTSLLYTSTQCTTVKSISSYSVISCVGPYTPAMTSPARRTVTPYIMKLEYGDNKISQYVMSVSAPHKALEEFIISVTSRRGRRAAAVDGEVHVLTFILFEMRYASIYSLKSAW